MLNPSCRAETRARSIVAVLLVTFAAACSGSDETVDASQGKDGPPTARWSSGVPVGLYFMTRFWPSSGSLEKSVWYFAPDGSVYRELIDGFSAADLAAHAGPTGKAVRIGEDLEITWQDGKKSKAGYSANATGFGWDAGIFTPVKPIASAAAIAGSYEGGESLSTGGGGGAVSRSIELRADGTYVSGAAGSLTSRTDQSQVSAGASGSEGGKWTASNYSITLTDHAGKVVRQIAFPYDDTSTPITPDHLYIGGTMYKKR
jgi:hypothetical protein